ncbi:hypothetical protein Anas_02270 [Armadillidium nasatum]|uniref:Uncharacterized protein n=1 Tax=Armadillidium nasatum TaxID=96803 RepID=A0A5N5TF39_9CRUS|nr:hypothetical protein Anas_02270 [Armadillidium nasatum]
MYEKKDNLKGNSQCCHISPLQSFMYHFKYPSCSKGLVPFTPGIIKLLPFSSSNDRLFSRQIVKEPISTERELVQLESLLSPKPAEERIGVITSLTNFHFDFRSKSPVVIESVNENLVKEVNATPLFLRNVNSLLEDMNWRILNKEYVPDLEFSLDLSLQQTGNIRSLKYLLKTNQCLHVLYRGTAVIVVFDDLIQAGAAGFIAYFAE